jgi:2-oxoglutarate dehydrogenase E2 component (dihydrolipoamide succinyltransferase)
MLTTFNEIDMSGVMDLRKKYKERFKDIHGIGLGFMSFFIKATVEALKQCPEINAYIDGDDICYRNYFDISVAVSTPKGLVVPVIKNCDQLSFAGVENTILDFALRGRDGKLTTDDMQGGGFTITNGGTFGSLLSTPILNPPQSAILGMHKIEDRPVAINGQVVIRPMMYVALSYDHRIVDGKEAVTFLVRIKECIEDPAKIMLEL